MKNKKSAVWLLLCTAFLFQFSIGMTKTAFAQTEVLFSQNMTDINSVLNDDLLMEAFPSRTTTDYRINTLKSPDTSSVSAKFSGLMVQTKNKENAGEFSLVYRVADGADKIEVEYYISDYFYDNSWNQIDNAELVEIEYSDKIYNTFTRLDTTVSRVEENKFHYLTASASLPSNVKYVKIKYTNIYALSAGNLKNEYVAINSIRMTEESAPVFNTYAVSAGGVTGTVSASAYNNSGIVDSGEDIELVLSIGGDAEAVTEIRLYKSDDSGDYVTMTKDGNTYTAIMTGIANGTYNFTPVIFKGTGEGFTGYRSTEQPIIFSVGNTSENTKSFIDSTKPLIPLYVGTSDISNGSPTLVSDIIFKNVSGTEKSACVLYAVYEKSGSNGRFCGYHKEDITMGAEEYMKYIRIYDEIAPMGGTDKEYFVRVFCWSDMTSLIPLCDMELLDINDNIIL